MARMLTIGPEAQGKVDKVVAYAMEHQYLPGTSAVPGNNPNFVAHLDTYRCVFTFTHRDGKVYRHLTISVPPEGKYPHPTAAFEIARMFGFTGYDEAVPMRPGDGWGVGMNEKENCIIIVQETGQ